MFTQSTADAPAKKKKKVLWIIIPAVLVIALAVLFLIRPKTKKQSTSGGAYRTKAVETRTIVNSLSGSGTLEPANSYTVTTLVEGDILEADFEEGDVVEKDRVLYRIDSSDAANNIEKAQISLASSKRSYEKATDRQYVKASVAGVVQSLDVKVGDKVKQGQVVATVRDNSVMTIKVPFAANDAESISVGQDAVITLDNTFETLYGKVETVASDSILSANNIPVRNVTVSVKSPGTLTDTQAATVSVGGKECMENATFTYRASATMTAESSGTITAVNVSEGTAVAEDQILCTIGGKDMEDSLRSAEDSLRNAEISISSTQKQLDDYTITSPIKGTIVDKQYKKGDTIEERGRTLCIIYDLEYLEMTLNIDELDISTVSVGQEVSITAEAVEGRTYKGIVTKVSVAGSTSNSTTVYPVTVRLDQTEGLLPGMNVDAEIVLSSAENVLSVPNEAVQRGGIVMLTKDSPSAANAIDREAPEGYVYVKVEIGVSDDDYTEVRSGLVEGDTVAYAGSSSGGSTGFSHMNMMTGGMNRNMGGGNNRNMGGGNNRNANRTSNNRSGGTTRR